MFDGTAVTAGPDQFILVYPRELQSEDFNAADDQGLLGKLLARLFTVDTAAMVPKKAALQNAFSSEGWYLSPVGRLHYSDARAVFVGGQKVKVRPGDLVHGAVIRNAVTPTDGTVPRTGTAWARSSAWCQTFHEVFAEPTGFSVQDAFGIEHLVKAYQAPRVRVDGRRVSVEALMFGTDVASWKASKIGMDLDLALAVWYSNSVNAPAIALRCMESALLSCGKDALFPKRLIRALGESNWGRWNASDRNGRYQRTRTLAMRSTLWPKHLFEGSSAIMPAVIPLEGLHV